MKKWNELRDYVIQCLVQTEVDHKKEMSLAFKDVLETMDELDKKHHKTSDRKD
jgi:hypothetical protein